MTSSQCFLLPKVGVEWEIISKKKLSPKIFDQGTAFLLTAHYFLPQSTIFTQFDNTGILNTKGFSRGMVNRFGRMSELNM